MHRSAHSFSAQCFPPPSSTSWNEVSF